MLELRKREALARELGGGLTADADADALMARLRADNHGRIAYDDDLEDDPDAPPPEADELWDELWTNYGDDTMLADNQPMPTLVKGRLVR